MDSSHGHTVVRHGLAVCFRFLMAYPAALYALQVVEKDLSLSQTVESHSKPRIGSKVKQISGLTQYELGCHVVPGCLHEGCGVWAASWGRRKIRPCLLTEISDHRVHGNS